MEIVLLTGWVFILVLLWKIFTASLSKSSLASEPAEKNSSNQRRYRTTRPFGIYRGPEDWQLRGFERNVFLYASEEGSVSVNSLPFAVIHFETTGIKPFHKHKIVEISVVLFSADGKHEETFSSLIKPGIPISNSVYHGISDEDVKDAPGMEDVLPYVLHLLSGRLVVSHNAPFEEVFLYHAAQRAGLPLNLFCAVDTLSLARICLDIPNHKLGTVCDYLGIGMTGPHEAEPDAIATAKLFLNLRRRRGLSVPQMPLVQESAKTDRPRLLIRRPRILKGTEGYMANVIRLLPMSSLQLDSQSEAAYMDMLTDVLADRKLQREEAANLAKLAIEVGLSAQRVRELNKSFLDRALEMALEDTRLEAEELRNLKVLAKLLGSEGYFDDLKAEKKRRDSLQ